jgi:phosphatidate cytidylyltransferase
LLRTRVLSALVLLPIVLVFVYLGGIPWLAGILLVGVLGWREMTQLLQRDHFTVDQGLGLFFVVGAIGEAFVFGGGLLQVEALRPLLQVDLLRPLLAGLIMFSLIWALFLRSAHPTADWGMTVASALYLGLMLSYFVALRERTNGMMWVLLALVLTWAIDAAAFFVGRAWGKHKWWPRLSPKKTWEGLAGGAVAALVVAPLLGMWWVGLSPWWGLLLGALAAAVDPMGDLAISLFKRRAGAKDSGQLIPGHGGVLDRLDSLLFMFPLVTYFALIVSGP